MGQHPISGRCIWWFDYDLTMVIPPNRASCPCAEVFETLNRSVGFDERKYAKGVIARVLC
ncbi:hypothetical protein MES5069_620160 [Mesorhizobium escarrei]|uniref:Uncharacterized protein n=1 Tax=Mesorhizobium escarrei TaxID=666018 RepID=A0ABN8KCG4_9HYPH|nr:hypothetical protein MES5069_620160 [Mesorhizobium escarrei]